MNLAHLIEDIQRQLNRLKGASALTFELITATLKDLSEVKERLAKLEKEKE